MINRNEVGEFLKALRKAKGLTQAELAEIINVSNKTVSKWESGVGLPELSTIIILADLYDISIDDILRGSKKPSKDQKKAENIISYLISKIKYRYTNLLIVALGLWLLSNITIIILGEITVNSTLSMGIGIFVLFISLFLQIFNLVHIRQKAREIEIEERNKIYKFIFNTSYLLLYLLVATFVFALLYNVGVNLKLTFPLILFRLIYAYAITGSQALLIYFIIRLFNIGFLPKMKTSNIILRIILYLILTIPFITINVSDPYKLSIKLQDSNVSYSVYDKDEETYYELKFLYLSSTGRIDYRFKYNEETYQLEYHYRFDDGYDLVMSTERYDFLHSLNYVDYDINEELAIGYIIRLPKKELRIQLYVKSVILLIPLYIIGYVIFVSAKRKKATN